jgi:hypothetical protein
MCPGNGKFPSLVFRPDFCPKDLDLNVSLVRGDLMRLLTEIDSRIALIEALAD